jgi:hypothetical protein
MPAPRRCASRRARAATSATGWITPVSLLASITETSDAGCTSAASTSAMSSTPSASTLSLRTVQPERARSCAGFMTQGCSIDDTAIRPGFRPAPAPRTNRLLASLPPEVNTTCDGWAPTSPATCARARLIASRARVPASCRLDALPYSPFR